MFQIKKILFPVDFSPRCRGAIGYVEAMAGKFDAEVILLNVVEPPAGGVPLQEMHEPAPESFDRFLGLGRKLLRVDREIAYGEAGAEIVGFAHARAVDLIMLPTKGLGTFRRLILGSTAAKVLHDADCPVWTGVHMETAPRMDAVSTQRILCAVDLQPASGQVLDWARHMADEYQAELALLHVLPGMTPGYMQPEQEADLRASIQKLIDELQARVGSQATVLIEGGDPAKLVSATAEQWGADLLVIGRRAEPGIMGRLAARAYS
ncbi:MAG: universal stress protein, partial [Bryobacterales bacterium]|nr:universal stress protein [Bryobacterales bacterium]